MAQSKTHVHFRIGGWTIAVRPDSSTRFPNVESVIPKAEQAKTRWHVLDEEAPTLAAMLDNLPAAKEDMAPITLDLTRPVVIRARGEDEKRCTDLALPHSRLEGKPLRVAMNREFLQRALKLGFRSVLITDPDKPLLCQEGRRLFVWVPHASTGALAPQSHAFRVVLPALVGKGRRTVTLAEPSRRPVPVRLPTRVPVPRPARVFDGFLNCARSLWNLVRNHHRKDAA